MRVVFGIIGAIVGGIAFEAATALIASIVTPSDWVWLAAEVVMLVVGPILGVVISQFVWRRQKCVEDKRRKAIYALAGIIAPIIASAGMAKLSNWRSWPPSDAAMIRHLRQNRGAYDQLVAMAQSDSKLGYIGDDSIRARDEHASAGVSESRIGQYRQLLRETGGDEGLESDIVPHGILVDYWNYGAGMSLFAPLVAKGYIYATVPPKPLVSSLDRCDETGGSDFEVYRHVTGNWYLYLSSEAS